MMLIYKRYLFLLMLFFQSASAGASTEGDLSVVGQLASGGAPELAVRLLNQAQPDVENNLSGWMFFEQQRIEILRSWGKWDDVVKRKAFIPDAAPASFVQWMKLQVADAYLQLGRGKEGREQLLSLLWRSGQTLSPESLSLYRRLIVRAYLLEDKLQDAQRAIHKYEQDYGEQGASWQVLYGRVMMRLGRYKDAADKLLNATSNKTTKHEANALKNLALLYSQKADAEHIQREVKAHLDDKVLTPIDRYRYLLVNAESYKVQGDMLAYTAQLEQAVLLSETLAIQDKVFQVTSSQIWLAYQQLGEAEGNKHQLLLGDDESWGIVTEQVRETSPVLARAMDIVVATQTSDVHVREIAQENIVDSYEKNMAIFHALMTDDEVIATPDILSDYTRYKLFEYALEQRRLRDAATWSDSLLNAPSGVEQLDWDLQRARTAVYSGNVSQGEEILLTYLSGRESLGEDETDKILQIAFDMQSVEANKAAISVFLRVLTLSTNATRQREMYFWLGQSYVAEKDYVKAAAYYLRSATLLDGYGFDPWGQTARFNGAEALIKEGALEDAERLLKQLLRVTVEPARKTVIQQQLQSILLLKNNQILSTNLPDKV